MPTLTDLPPMPPALETLPALCRRHHVRGLDVLGSAATGSFGPARSDIDLLVTFEDLPAGGLAEAYFGLHALLEALFHRKVDLLTKRSIENPFWRRSIKLARPRLYN